MARSTRLRLATAFVAIASMTLLGATSKALFDPLESVHPGAIVVVSVGDPSALYSNAIAFLRNAGLGGPADSLAGLVESMVPSGTEGQEADSKARLFRAMDPSKRIVAAIYPAEDGAGQPSATLFIPIRAALSPEDSAALSTALDEMLKGEAGAMSIATDYPGYAVISTGGSAIPAYGSGAAMDLKSLAAYPASSLAVWADPVAGAAYLDTLPGGLGSMLSGSSGEYDDYDYSPEEAPDEYAPIDNTSIDGTSAEDNAEYAEDYPWDNAEPESGFEAEAPADPTAEQMASLGKALKEGLSDLSAVEVALTVREDGIWLRTGARLKNGSKLAAMAERASAGDRSIPYLSFCDSDAIVSIAWSAPYDWGLPLLEALYKAVLGDEGLTAATMDAMKGYAAVAGMNGGMSIGLEPSAEIIQAVRSGDFPEGDEMLAMLGRGLGLKFSGAMDVTDRQAFRDAAGKSLDLTKNPAYQELLASSGFTFDMRRSVGKAGGMPYDAYTYDIKPAEGTVDEGTAAAFRLISDIAAPVYFYSGDNVLFGLGDPAAAAASIRKGGAKRSLRADKAFKAIRAGAPADTRAILYVSTKSLVRLLLRMMPEDGQALDFSANDMSGMLGWFDATPSTMGFGMGIGAEDIKAIIAIAK
ncbi:MAG: hypothetical protein CVV47_07245 [Spirochaetae bacterium HGW-Spirochaetae-3]|nr:MAG: hypothetical protein CVV47_07245 [Spirochaetae bacterium HGW-Spirochaetae-3]